MTSKFIGLSEIIERVYRSTEYDVLPWSDAAEDVLDCLRLLGVPGSYIDTTTNGQRDNPVPIIITNFRGELPFNLAVPGPCRLIQLDSNFNIITFKPMIESQDLFYQSPTVVEEFVTSVKDHTLALTTTSLNIKLDLVQSELDSLNTQAAIDGLEDIVGDIKQAESRVVTSNSAHADFFPKYKLNNDYIFTNFKEGFVEMSYKALPVDSNGMPMVPDNIRFIKAVEWYLISRIDYKRWRTTRNPSDQKIWEHSDRESLWYLQSARTAAHMPSLDKMESIKRMLMRSIPKINMHADGWKSASTQEQRKF
jgi:hypothetical protein